jgi:hypothetical protein
VVRDDDLQKLAGRLEFRPAREDGAWATEIEGELTKKAKK